MSASEDPLPAHAVAALASARQFAREWTATIAADATLHSPVVDLGARASSRASSGTAPTTSHQPQPATHVALAHRFTRHPHSQTNSTTPAATPYNYNVSRIYVGALHYALVESDIRAIFAQFGVIRSVSLAMTTPVTNTTGIPQTGSRQHMISNPLVGSLPSIPGIPQFAGRASTQPPITPTTTPAHQDQQPRNRGFCFVEFERPEAAVLAMQELNDFELGGRRMRVCRPNNFNIQLLDQLRPVPGRIYLANITDAVTEEDLRSIFEAFGEVTLCTLTTDPTTGLHNGTALVQFADPDIAEAAVEGMNRFELGGQLLYCTLSMTDGDLPLGDRSAGAAAGVANSAIVAFDAKAASLVDSYTTTTSTPTTTTNTTTGAIAADGTDVINGRAGGRGSVTSTAPVTPASATSNAATAAPYEVMKRLARQHLDSKLLKMTNIPYPELEPSDEARPVSQRTPLLEEELSVLAEEFHDELAKFGAVNVLLEGVGFSRTRAGHYTMEQDWDVKVDLHDHTLTCFALFSDVSAARAAQQSFDKRYFAGRQISAEFWDADYVAGRL